MTTTMAGNQSSKRANNFKTLEHQARLIQQGICPDTLKPMKQGYYKDPAFRVQYSEHTAKFYYPAMPLKELWLNIKRPIKFYLLSRVFEIYVKIVKRYPEEIIKEYDTIRPVQDN